MRLPESCKGEIEWGDLEPFVDWMGEDYDYLQGSQDRKSVV